jgi:uncharacterized membrane protein YgdD (TMEM256/DUF423 family)
MTNNSKLIDIPKQLITIGCLGAIAVALGALGAHALKGQLQTGLINQDQLNGFDTAVKYQMYHTLAMLAVVLLQTKYNSKFFSRAYTMFLFGIIFFSGSLYFLCTRNLFGADWLKFLGPITPIGGLFFIAGWFFLAFAAIQKPKNN